MTVLAPPPDTTTTAVACVPSTFPLANSTACTATVTDTHVPSHVPTGNASFASNDAAGSFDNTTCPLVSNGDGKSASCTVNYTAPDVGTPTITASYPGDNVTFTSSSGTTMLTVTTHPTSTAVSCVPAGSGPGDVLPVNGSSACTVTVTDTGALDTLAPTGSVNFTSDDPSGTFDNASCTLNDNGDGMSSSCTVNYTPPDVGTPTITATYVNDPAFDPSSGTEMLNVTARPTTTTISCVPAGSGPTDILSAGSPSNCTATVTDTSATPTVPTGSVNFSSDDPNGTFDNTSCTLNDDGDGMDSSCSVNYTPPTPGTPTITGTYVNDPPFAASSGQEQLNVTSSAATTTVSCTPSTLPAGVSSACTVNVANTNSFGAGPTGTVTLTDNGAGGTFDSTSCLLVDSLDGVNSSCTVNYTLDASGTPTITASYPGDPANGPSSGSEQLTYNVRTTTTALSCNPAAPPATTLTTCMVTVTDTDLAPTSAPSGVVSFANVGSGSFTPNTNDCTLVDNGDGMSASCTIIYTPTAQQTQQLTASYPGDTAHAAGSAQIDLVVGFPPADTTSTVVSCAPASLQAQTGTTCTATVTDTGATPTNPTGTVAFTSSAGGSFSTTSGDCAINPSGTGQSQCSVTFVPSQAGSPTITATFVGNVGFAGSSATQGLSVSGAPPDPTSTTVACVPSSVQVGTSSNCTITVTDTHAAPTAPTGSVTLSSGRSCALSATGVAQSSCSIPFEPGAAGSFTLTAAYGGNAAYVASSGQTEVTATPVPVLPPPPPPKKPVPPSNSFSFGKLVVRKAGSDTLQINVPDAGKVVLVGSGVKTVRLSSRGRSTLTATIVATGSKLRTLKRRHTVVVSLRVTFTPTGGSPRTLDKSVRLRITKKP